MLSSNEIKTKTFSVVKKGYDPKEVEDFLSAVAAELDSFQSECAKMVSETRAECEKEKNDMESKMLVLADAVENYRSQETIIRNALINAEKMKETVVNEAKQNADILIKDAQTKAETILKTAGDKVALQEAQYRRIQEEVVQFKSRMVDMYRQHISLLSSLPDEVKITESAPDEEKVNKETESVEVIKDTVELEADTAAEEELFLAGFTDSKETAGTEDTADDQDKREEKEENSKQGAERSDIGERFSF